MRTPLKNMLAEMHASTVDKVIMIMLKQKKPPAENCRVSHSITTDDDDDDDHNNDDITVYFSTTTLPTPLLSGYNHKL